MKPRSRANDSDGSTPPAARVAGVPEFALILAVSTSSLLAARVPMVSRWLFVLFNRTLSETSSLASTSIDWPGLSEWLSMKRRNAAS